MLNLQNNQIHEDLIKEAIVYLRSIQQDFNTSEYGKINHNKLAVDLDINDDEIVLFFDTHKDTGFTVVLNAEFVGNEVQELDIEEVEVDIDGEQFFILFSENKDDLLLEIKRIIHDAHYYNIDDNITTVFHDEVYSK